MLLSKINDLKQVNYASKEKQNFMKFNLKMLLKCKSLTLLTMQIINYASNKIFLHMQVLSNRKLQRNEDNACGNRMCKRALCFLLKCFFFLRKISRILTTLTDFRQKLVFLSKRWWKENEVI